MSAPQWHSAVVPAQLAFLAIYNPSLGPTDETFHDQLVFYYSRAAHDARVAAKRTARNNAAGADALRAEENEKLRHIGLAQGMVDFARSFSNGEPVDFVDTEKSRIVLHELENGWWILASVDLTRLPVISQNAMQSPKRSGEGGNAKPVIEYSAREVSPPALLLSQLVQAHLVFTLHHGPSLSELFVKLSRDKFCGVLDRFWTRFARSWDVLLHGNPATDIFCGMKLSSGGELGMGVGEEEWGSGERDVLEDLIRTTDGLVDLIVSRFGEPAPSREEQSQEFREDLPWLGSGTYPLASDGIIFSGNNAISRESLRNVSLWMRQIYTYADHAYGVRDNPHRERKKRRQRRSPISTLEGKPSRQMTPPSEVQGRDDTPAAGKDVGAPSDSTEHPEPELRPHLATQELGNDIAEHDGSTLANELHPGIPPPIVPAVQNSLKTATERADIDGKQKQAPTADTSGTTLGIPDQYMKYLTFGLSTFTKSGVQTRPGTSRQSSGSSSQATNARQTATATKTQRQEEVTETDEDGPQLSQIDPIPDGLSLNAKINALKWQEEHGQFVIGLKGDLNEVPDDPNVTVSDVDDEFGGVRNVLRTVQVEVIPSVNDDRTELQRKLSAAGLGGGRNDPLNFRRLRVLVYVRRPFMYCFLFKDRTPSLDVPRFYKTLHYRLQPIHKSLLSSTSVLRINQRIEETQADASATASDTASVMSNSKSHKTSSPKPIYDLLWDPARLMIRTSIPNIPEPGTPAAEGIAANRKDSRTSHASDWTRVEALNVHSQILNTHASTLRNQNEYERTSKTSRGWWVVWMKLSWTDTDGSAAAPNAQSEDGSTSTSSKGRETVGGYLGAPLETTHSDETLRPSGHTSVSAASPSTHWLESSVLTRKIYQPAYRVAFLVRKATDAAPPAKSDVTSRAVTSMWQSLSLRSSSTADETTGGAEAGWGPAALGGGIGIDARKYVDGLLQLNR